MPSLESSSSTMLPPLDPSIFERNPRFKALYDDLSQNKLNADASTKNSKKQIQAERAREEVNAKQTNAAKTNIIGSTLDHVAWKDARLPEEMHEVTVIAADQVNRRISKNHQDILEPDLEFFKENIESVSALLEDSITSTALQLCRIIDPVSTDDLDCSLLDDPPHILGRQQEIEAQSSSLGAYRAHLSDLAASIMQAQAELMEVVVRIMEQTAHGTLARFLRAKAEHLAAVSEGLEKKLSIVTLSQETPASLQMALKKYKEHVSREKSELEHRGEIASDKLNAFDEAGKGRGDMMRQIAQRYVEIEAEIQKVQREMEKLDGR
ncbi:hypothetical protein IWX90DRAFT_165881 [Phyllosticta citrichinensis]|uniref:Uncharacterized protein n=1 Tax=Phyllosticta citrichinensis TaxID=1130410 RepID=A0ABR1Y133_9PEZI